MRIFKHRSFHQWAKAEGITDQILKNAIDEMGKGLHDGNLGSGLYKKRIAPEGRGKRGSHRTLVAFKKEQSAFFVYGFAKSVRDNIDDREEKIYRQLAKSFLDMNEDAIKKLIEKINLVEVK